MPRDLSHFLADILASCEAIGRITAATTQQSLFTDSDERTLPAVERHLFIIGEAASQIPEAVRSRHPEVAWRQIIATRNILAHGYWRIDRDVLWNIIEHDIAELAAQIRKIQGLPAVPP